MIGLGMGKSYVLGKQHLTYFKVELELRVFSTITEGSHTLDPITTHRRNDHANTN